MSKLASKRVQLAEELEAWEALLESYTHPDLDRMPWAWSVFACYRIEKAALARVFRRGVSNLMLNRLRAKCGEIPRILFPGMITKSFPTMRARLAFIRAQVARCKRELRKLPARPASKKGGRHASHP